VTNLWPTIGLNRYQSEIANIREQCSWVHYNIEKATEKAHVIIRQSTEKVKLNELLDPITVPVTRKALVVGGGIAGIRAALDVANSGHQVYRNPHTQLAYTEPDEILICIR
jgi:heterodisulfide reductase subunit A